MRLIINFLLLIIALTLLFIVGLTCTIALFITAIFTGYVSSYSYNLALSIDQFGNVFIAPLANMIFKKKGGYDFGDPDETISYSLGMNKKLGKLTLIGKGLCLLLGMIDPDHCGKSLENN